MDRSAAWLDAAPASAFTSIDASVRRGGRPVANLHQGKTYFAPCAAPAPWGRDEFPLLAHEHAPPGGIPALRETAADYVKNRHNVVVDPADVVITNGATHGVFTVLNAVLEPGDEVVLLSPQWLFAAGLVASARGRAVPVPTFLATAADPDYDVVAGIEAVVGPRTRAVYFNTPNNPTGIVLPPSALRRLVDLAHRCRLWLVADNAYENYDFTEAGFVDVATLPGAAERTYSVYTLSKTFAMPGYRVGYVVAPPGRGADLVTAGLYSVYSVATVAQRAAAAALATSPNELGRRRQLAAAAWEMTHELLRVPHTEAGGGLYTLLDLTACGADPDRFLAACTDAGVSLSPGAAFGAVARRHARLCYTAVPPDILRPAIEVINTVYRRFC
jgi:aspartate aminotransferase/N-succinyldiaminopimelate aminotransferase